MLRWHGTRYKSFTLSLCPLQLWQYEQKMYPRGETEPANCPQVPLGPERGSPHRFGWPWHGRTTEQLQAGLSSVLHFPLEDKYVVERVTLSPDVTTAEGSLFDWSRGLCAAPSTHCCSPTCRYRTSCQHSTNHSTIDASGTRIMLKTTSYLANVQPLTLLHRAQRKWGGRICVILPPKWI